MITLPAASTVSPFSQSVRLQKAGFPMVMICDSAAGTTAITGA